jgi:hypothetical protein
MDSLLPDGFAKTSGILRRSFAKVRHSTIITYYRLPRREASYKRRSPQSLRRLTRASRRLNYRWAKISAVRGGIRLQSPFYFVLVAYNTDIEGKACFYTAAFPWTPDMIHTQRHSFLSLLHYRTSATYVHLRLFTHQQAPQYRRTPRTATAPDP